MSALVLGPPGTTERSVRGAVSWLLICMAFVVAGAGVAGGDHTMKLGVGAAFVLFLGALLARVAYLPWEKVIAALVLVILFIPLRRYMLPGDAGLKLEPYRVLVALIFAGWCASLLIDRRLSIRGSRIGAPLAAVMLVILVSILANPARVMPLQPTVLKAVTFMFSFVVVMYLIVSVLRTQAAIDTVAKTLVAGGAVVAVLAVVEARLHVSPFGHLDVIIPILVQDPSFGGVIERGGALRAVGSAEHPIALSAALVMLVPLATYVVRIGGPRWYIALVALVVGVLSTVSRTGVMMLIAIAIVFIVLRPKETRRIAPVLIPLLVVTHFAVPGTLGALHQAFLPEGGLVSEQQGDAGSCDSSGRVADIGPTLQQVGEKPFFGYGFGTRIVTGPDRNGCILDNQWLGTLVEVGFAGFIAWWWLFLRVIRRFGKAAKHDQSPTGWLLVAVTASVAAYSIGSFTFDALGFSQVTFLLFLVLGVGAAGLANKRAEGPEPIRPADRRARGAGAASVPARAL